MRHTQVYTTSSIHYFRVVELQIIKVDLDNDNKNCLHHLDTDEDNKYLNYNTLIKTKSNIPSCTIKYMVFNA